MVCDSGLILARGEQSFELIQEENLLYASISRGFADCFNYCIKRVLKGQLLRQTTSSASLSSYC